MAKKKEKQGRQIFLRLVFLIYVGVMLWLLFGQRWGTKIYAQELARNINLQPLATIKLYLCLLKSTDLYMVRHAFMNLVGNVVMFIPLGFYQPYLLPKLRGFFRTMLSTTLLVLIVEIVQYISLLGSCDVDDLLLNLIGSAMGYLFWQITRR